MGGAPPPSPEWWKDPTKDHWYDSNARPTYAADEMVVPLAKATVHACGAVVKPT
jgi:hypothetical protein